MLRGSNHCNTFQPGLLTRKHSAWEQRKLGEVATFGGGHTPSMADSDNYDGGSILWVTSQDVKVTNLSDTTTHITEKAAGELTVYPAGTLVMVVRSGILRHTLPVAKLRKPAAVNQDIKAVCPGVGLDGQWLMQYLLRQNKSLLLEFGKTGTTVESVDFEKIKAMAIPLPSPREQEAIGALFARLDSLITLHQREAEPPGTHANMFGVHQHGRPRYPKGRPWNLARAQPACSTTITHSGSKCTRTGQFATSP